MIDRYNLEMLGAALAAFGICALTIPLIRRVAHAFDIVVAPHSDSHRRGAIPLLGGLAVITAALLTMASFSVLPWSMLIGGSGLLLLGVIDDVTALRPSRKLAWEAVITIAAIATAKIPMLTPWLPLNWLIVTFWLLATINAFNLIDGLDGLAGGIGITASLAVAAIAGSHGNYASALQALAVAGALGGFLLFNFHPASIFLGDGGALPGGFMLGMLALDAGNSDEWLTRFAVPALIMIVPLLDMGIVSVSRMATNRAPTRRGLDHSHHKLLALGLPDRVAVSVCWVVSLLAGACAFGMRLLPGAYLVISLPFIVGLFGLIGLFMIDLTFDLVEPGETYKKVGGLARFIVHLGYKRRLAEAGLDLFLVTGAYFGAFLIRFDFVTDRERVLEILPNVPLILAGSYLVFFTLGIYRGFWRYAGLSEIARLASASIGAGTVLLVIDWFYPIMMSGSIAVLFVLILFNELAASRLSFRVFRKGIALLSRSHRAVLVVGASELAEVAARYLTSGSNRDMKLVGFVDLDSFKAGKMIHGAPVLGSLKDLDSLVSTTHFTELLIANTALGADAMAKISAFARANEITVYNFSIELSEFLPEAGPGSTSVKEIPLGELTAAKSFVA